MLSAHPAGALTLQGAVHQVLVTHPLTPAAVARVQAALATMSQARAYPNPALTFTYNDPSRERTYTVRQPLEWPFQRTARIGAAAADVQSAEAEQAGIRQDLIAAAREAFFRAL